MKMDGNLIGILNIQNKTSHNILLNYHSKSTRGKSKEEVLTELKEKLSKLKDDVQQNLISNLQDQNSEQSWYLNWLGLDLTISLSLDQHMNRLLEVIHLYITKYAHVKANYANDKHKDVEDDLWEGHSVHLHHQPAIDECSADNLSAELKRPWPTINSLWMSESNLVCVENRKPNQHLIWIKFQQEYFLEFPNVVRLCQIMATTPANTSPLERSYTKLQLVAAKRRNHFTSENLEVLYLLAAINHVCVPCGATEYDAEMKKLE